MAKVSGQNGKAILSTNGIITGASGTTTITVTHSSGAVAVGDRVLIEGVVGMTDINGEHTVTGIGGGDFDIVIPTTGQTYVSAGTFKTIVSIMTWGLDIVGEVIQTTDSGDSDWHTFIDSEFKGGSGTFEAFFITGATDKVIGTSTVLVLRVDSANYYTCTAFITANTSTVDVPGTEAVKKTYTFTATSTIVLTAA